MEMTSIEQRVCGLWKSGEVLIRIISASRFFYAKEDISSIILCRFDVLQGELKAVRHRGRWLDSETPPSFAEFFDSVLPTRNYFMHNLEASPIGDGSRKYKNGGWQMTCILRASSFRV